MSSVEFAEWMAYDAIEPIGEPRADLRAGLICSTIVNAYGGRPVILYGGQPRDAAAPFPASAFMPFEVAGREGPRGERPPTLPHVRARREMERRLDLHLDMLAVLFE